MAQRFTDRKLGKNWEDWNGSPGAKQEDLPDGPGTFLLLFAAGLSAITLLLLLDAFVMSRLFSQTFPSLIKVVYYLIGLVLAFWWAVFLITLAALLLEIELVALPWLSKWLPLQLPLLRFCAQFKGLDRDQVGAACVQATNALSRLRLQSASTSRPLLLLPRCLDALTLAKIQEVAEERDCPVALLNASREARGKILEAQATCAIAIACERDLVGGDFDFIRQIPVIALAVRRPSGPCLNTNVNLRELREAFDDCGMRGL